MVEIQIEIEEVVTSFKGLTGHWTKWGGRRYDLVADRQDSIVPEIWSCQSCADQQPFEITPFKYEYPEGEYIRVCAICYADNCEKLFKRLENE